MGDGAGTALTYSRSVASMKCLNGSYAICLEAKRQNPELIIVARTLHTDYGALDCPQDWNYGSPATWWAAIKNYLPDGFDAYEIQNECGPPPQGYAYWAQWNIAIARLVQRDKGGILLAFAFAAGNPDYPHWLDLIEYFRWVAQNPLPDGRYHGLALHAAANASWNRSDSPWINNPHLTADRYFLFVRDVMLANTGFDLSRWPGTVAFTEIGLHDGYSGNWGAVYSCAEIADAYKTTAAKLQSRAVMQWWNIGQVSRWTSSHECLPQMIS